jgi:hypothetical protein
VEPACDLDRIAGESTSLAASRNTSCCADRISASMMAMAMSFFRSNPAMRYHTDVARSLGVMGLPRCPMPGKYVNVYEERRRMLAGRIGQ